MQKNILLISLALLVLTIFSFGIVTPLTVYIDTNRSTSIVAGGSVILNASLSGAAANVGYNCTWYAKSSITDNSSWVNLGSSRNNTLQTMVNLTFNSHILRDANNYYFNASCYKDADGTDVGTSNTSYTMTIDNGKPAVINVGPTTNTSSSITFVANVRNATRCYLTFIDRGIGTSKNYTMTRTIDVCSQSINPVPDQTYKYLITTSDESNTTDSSMTNLIVTANSQNTADMAPQQEALAQEQLSKSQNNQIIIVIAIVAIIAVLGWIIGKRK